MKKEFRERFGRAFRSRVRVPDGYVPKFLHLKEQLGHKSDQETVEWLMNQAAPAPRQEGGKESDPINVNSTYQVNQVWALWDDHVDGMPRSYARIHKLFLEDLEAQVVFLEPVPTTDDETQWSLDSSLPMACGTFKEGASTTTVDIFAFSHQVNIGEGLSVGRIFHRIFPHKGEVWAVFKDWNINWTLHDFMARTRYEFVEVESYVCEGNGVAGVCLTRVGLIGYVFKRHGKNVQFFGKELLRFSHRVPASKLRGEDECWELNPAALPLYLL